MAYHYFQTGISYMNSPWHISLAYDRTISCNDYQGLKEIWLENDLLWTLRKRRLKGKCGSCILKYACGGCQGDAYAIYGDVLAEDPFCPYNPIEKTNVA